MARQRAEADVDLLTSYLREIARYPQLTAEEEQELARRIRDGDSEALDKLVRCNLRFVVSYAKKYRNKEIQFLDLIEEGNVGLIEAAKRFDPDKDVKFITYAVWWVRQAILQALAEQTRAFRVPARQATMLRKLEKVIAESVDADEGMPSPDALAERLEVSVDEITTLLGASGASQSLNQELSSSVELGELIEQDLIDGADEVYQKTDVKEQLLSQLDQLADRERLVLMLRYGIGSDEPLPLSELARIFEMNADSAGASLRGSIEQLCTALTLSSAELSHLLLFRNPSPRANWTFWVEFDDHHEPMSAEIDPRRRDKLLEVNRSGELQDALDELEPLGRALVLMRYGILEDESFTLQQIGEMLGVSRERVRQIEAKAESRCRKRAERR